jgi:HD-like signal output (HDOD) protein
MAPVFRDMDKLSSVPYVYAQLDEAIRTSRVSAAHISSIISQDTSLTARLLKIVNSAFFSFPRKVDTISRAVIIVGTQQLRDLALATSVINSFSNIPERYITMESFWRHSIACGLASRIIAGYFKAANVERYFVAGILHDIGRLMIATKMPEETASVFRIAEQRDQPLHVIEREVLGFDHAQVGSELIDFWRLPKSFEEIILYHHEPTLANLYRNDAAVIHIADSIVHAMQLGNTGDECIPPIREQAWELLGLPVDILPYVMDQIDKQFNDAVHGFIAH